MIVGRGIDAVLAYLDPDDDVCFREIYGEPDFGDGYKITGMVYGVGRVEFTNENLS